MLVASADAPASSSSRAAVAWPLSAAKCKAVSPPCASSRLQIHFIKVSQPFSRSNRAESLLTQNRPAANRTTHFNRICESGAGPNSAPRLRSGTGAHRRTGVDRSASLQEQRNGAVVPARGRPEQRRPAPLRRKPRAHSSGSRHIRSALYFRSTSTCSKP